MNIHVTTSAPPSAQLTNSVELGDAFGSVHGGGDDGGDDGGGDGATRQCCTTLVAPDEFMTNFSQLRNASRAALGLKIHMSLWSVNGVSMKVN